MSVRGNIFCDIIHKFMKFALCRGNYIAGKSSLVSRVVSSAYVCLLMQFSCKQFDCELISCSQSAQQYTWE